MPRRNSNATLTTQPTGKRTQRYGFTNICPTCGADPRHFTHANYATNGCPYATTTTEG
jgi:hypothetical protein